MNCPQEEVLVSVILVKQGHDEPFSNQAEIEAHLEACPSCRKRFRRFSEEFQGYTPWDPETTPEIPLPRWAKERLAEMRRSHGLE